LHAIELLDSDASRVSGASAISTVIRWRSIARRHAAAIDSGDEAFTQSHGISVSGVNVGRADIVARVTVSSVAGAAALGVNRLNVSRETEEHGTASIAARIGITRVTGITRVEQVTRIG
jgi:hypothetical protein